MFSFSVTVLVLIQVIATSGGQSVLDERNQQVRMVYQVLIKIYYYDLLCLLSRCVCLVVFLEYLDHLE